MGRINNGNWVNQHRKIQGKFQNKQDIEAYLLDTKLGNGNNIQENNRLNIDDLPNIPALLADEPNLSVQSIIEPIDGGKAHTPATQVFLSTLTALSVISANTTASSKQAISTDSQNSLSSTVKSFTEMSKSSPVLFDTTSAIMSTSQNHDESKESTTHNDNQSLIRVKRAGISEYDIYDEVYDIYDEVLYIQDVFLDTEMIKQKLQDNSNVNEESSTSTMEFSTTKEESSKDISGKQEKQEDLTTPKGNIIEKSEPIAENYTTPTPKESNPHDPTSSTISIGEPVGLTALAVSIISAIGGAVVYVTKKFCDGKKSYTHNDLPLAELISVIHLDNDPDISLSGVLVNNDADI